MRRAIDFSKRLFGYIRFQVSKRIPFRVKDFFYVLQNINTNSVDYVEIKHYFKEKHGLEIGGPSVLFRTELPIYRVITNMDNVNFARETLWESGLTEEKSFQYGTFHRKTGRQIICDATDLSEIPSLKYDFVISSNTLEHIANPIRALNEWQRIIKNKGFLLVVVPKKESNFDHKREIALFSHIIEDFNQNTNEDSLFHLEEILEKHDLDRDIPAGNSEDFRKRSENNYQNRSLHHHVFDNQVIKEMLTFAGFSVTKQFNTPTDYFTIGVKN